MPTTDYDIYWVGENGVRSSEGLLASTAGLEQTRDGKTTASVVYTCLWSNLSSVIDYIKANPHPDFPLLTFESLSASRSEAGYTEITVNYAGLTDDTGDDGGDESYNDGNSWAIDASVSEAPITTHPNFTEFTDETNATFDSDGSFVKYKMYVLSNAGPSPALPKNPLYGLQAYKRVGSSITQTMTVTSSAAKTKVDKAMKTLGYIDTSLAASAPSWLQVEGEFSVIDQNDEAYNKDARNALLIAVQVEELGKGAVRIQKTWELSGPGGWPKDIYEKPEP